MSLLKASRSFALCAALFSATAYFPTSIAKSSESEPKTPDSAKAAQVERYKALIQEALTGDKFQQVIEYALTRTVRADVTKTALLKAATDGMRSCVEASTGEEKQPDAEMMETCGLKAALSELSPHDGYMDREEAAQWREQFSGKFTGVGIEIQPDDAGIKVINPIEGSPALVAGVLAGDLITHVDGKPLAGKDISEGVKLMRGKKDTPVRLTISRGGNTIPDITVIRNDIKRQNVRHEVIDGRYGYVSVQQFNEDAAKDVRNAYLRIKMETGSDLKGVVLDLRGNPGGLLTESGSMADDLISGTDTIVSQKHRGDTETGNEIKAKRGQFLNGIPVVVLQDGGSASASEIVAAALQDDLDTTPGQPRAVIMGKQSFGKGTVQSVGPWGARKYGDIGDGTIVKITTASFHRKNGHCNQHIGIVPDVVTYSLDPQLEEALAGRITERKLPKSIPNPEGTAIESSRTKQMCGPIRQDFSDAGIDRKFTVTLRERANPSKVITRLDFDKICAVDYLKRLGNPDYRSPYTVTGPYDPAIGVPKAQQPAKPALTN